MSIFTRLTAQLFPACVNARTLYAIFMKSLILLAVLSVFLQKSLAQSKMEIDCLEQVRNITRAEIFPKYDGIIVCLNDTIHFGKSLICTDTKNYQLLSVFTKGLIFPNLVRSASTRGDAKFKMTDFTDSDTLHIESIHELNIPNQKVGVKSFSFILWRKGLANPSLYLFELTNQVEYSNSSLEKFLPKAKLTAFGFCSILI